MDRNRDTRRLGASHAAAEASSSRIWRLLAPKHCGGSRRGNGSASLFFRTQLLGIRATPIGNELLQKSHFQCANCIISINADIQLVVHALPKVSSRNALEQQSTRPLSSSNHRASADAKSRTKLPRQPGNPRYEDHSWRFKKHVLSTYTESRGEALKCYKNCGTFGGNHNQYGWERGYASTAVLFIWKAWTLVEGRGFTCRAFMMLSSGGAIRKTIPLRE